MAEKKAYAYRDKLEVLDQLVGTIGLVLIVFLMVSLTFFLLARFSLSSEWTSSHWILFWEVLATVLVSRMFLIDDLKEVVGGYSFVLGMVIWVPFSLMGGEILGIVTVLMIFVGWFTYKITWDVTDLGEREEDEDGLLASVGLKKELNPGNKKVSESWGDTREESTEFNYEAEEVLAELATKKPKKVKGGKGRGVWVLYFLFGSIPVFGLGGSTQNSTDPNLGKYFLVCLCIYLASCISLLMSTSFLTIRSDLRRRNLSMPLFTAGFWLFSGLFLLISCFVFASLLPRPQGFLDPIALVLSKGQDKDQDASNYAKSSEKSGKGDGNPGEKEGDKGSPKDGNQKAGKPTEDKDNKGASKESGKGESDSGEKGGGSSKEGAQKSGQSKNNKGKSDTRKSDGNQKSNSTSNQEPPASPPSSFNIPGLDKMMAALEVILKVVFAVGTFLFVLYVVVYKLSFSFGWADNLLDWFRNLFDWLDRSKKKKKQEDIAEASVADETLPFENFDNPFDRKDWQKSSLRELTGYTWKALLAWCKSQNISIPRGCTPSELEEIISNEMPRIEPAYYAFQQVLLNVQYSNNNDDPKGVATTQNLWHHMNGESNAAAGKD
ncbi:MAG: hypothetical protein NTV50_12025 [Planctomycetota bacterium]|nr:hypothetical protein [Planctomycetota bacterium]